MDKKTLKERVIGFYTAGDVKQRILNASISVALVSMFPCAISIVFQDADPMNYLLIGLFFIVGLLSLALINIFKKVTFGAVVLIVFADFFVIPLTHIYAGGSTSGVICFELFGYVFIWIVLDGWVCAILTILDTIVITSCYLFEIFYPEKLVPIPGKYGALWDKVFCTVIVGIFFGAIIRFERRIFKRQQKQIYDGERQTREALYKYEKASRAKSDFLANMSHEVRTPVNTINGMCEMILRESTEENIVSYAGEISLASDSLIATINQVLDYSKLDAKVLELEHVEYSVGKLLNDCFNYVNEKAERKHLELKIRNNPFLPSRLYGDEVRVRMIITNLLTNAIKFTKEGSVSMSVDFSHESGDTVILKIVVKDTGVGIEKDRLDLLLNQSRELSDDSDITEGIGLGLVIIRTYVEKMGGKVLAESEIGKGSTFSVTIKQRLIDRSPLGNLAEKLYVKGPEKHRQYEPLFVAPNVKILSVDDVKMNQDVIKVLLKGTEVSIDTVFGGEEAIEAVKKKKYDLILMDHMMPKMNGIEALHEIKKLENGNIPCIVLTANAVSGSENNYLKEGFSCYLTKPVNGEELEKVLMKYLPENMIKIKRRDPVIIEPNVIKEETPMYSSLITEDTFRKISFLDFDKGFELCAYSLELYIEATEGYVGADNKTEELEKAFEEKNWDEYRVAIHAVKSSSLLLGACDLSNSAKYMEDALKEGDIPYVLDHHSKVMDEYKNVLDSLRGLLVKYNVIK